MSDKTETKQNNLYLTRKIWINPLLGSVTFRQKRTKKTAKLMNSLIS